VTALCQRLEGIPLALELAAARAQVLTPAQMLAHLEQRFEFLVSRQPRFAARHRTLRATLDWSYQLLSPDLQRFFARLSVFRGGWTLEAAEAVCAEEGVQANRSSNRDRQDGQDSRAGRNLPSHPAHPCEFPGSSERPAPVVEYMEQLRQCSLVTAEEAGTEMRYRMLETLQEYGGEQLSAEARDRLGERHARYFQALADQAEAERAGPGVKAWLDRLEREHDNLRAALDWCLGSGVQEAPTLGLSLAASLGWFWYPRGYWAEGRERLARLLALPAAQARTAPRAGALYAAGRLAWAQSDYAAARVLHEEALAIRQELGDPRGIAASLCGLGTVARRERDVAAARRLLEESLAICRAVGDLWGTATALSHLGSMAHDRREFAEARQLHEESLAIGRALGNRTGSAYCLRDLGHLALDQKDYVRARPLFEESLALMRDVGDQRGIASALHFLGRVTHEQGDFPAARELLEDSLAIRRELGDRHACAWVLSDLSHLAEAQGDHQAARALHDESQTLMRQVGDEPGTA
jgi:tetratricopeptide (TPR) repeat protein